MLDFANKLKELRTAKAMSQKDLAIILNVSQNAIFNWENNKREPALSMVQQIAKYFNVSVDSLIGATEPTSDSVLFAYFDITEYTKEELEEIKKFADFIKVRRK